jgi:hypothetical protein
MIDGHDGHVPHSPAFIALELFCMSTIIIDVFTDIFDQGCFYYWSGYEEQGADGESGFVLSKFIWNYLQFFTLLVCLTLPVMLVLKPSGNFDELDDVLVACLTFVRYCVYVVYLLLWARNINTMQQSVEKGKVDFDEPEDSINDWDSPRESPNRIHDERMSKMALRASSNTLSAT